MVTTPKLTSSEAADLVKRANEVSKIPASKRAEFFIIDIDESVLANENIKDYPVTAEVKKNLKDL